MKFQGDLGNDEVRKLLVTLSLPAMIGMTVQALYNVVDTFWVGRLGAEAIAALTICFPIQMILIALASGTGTGLSSIISRRLGEKRPDDAKNAVEHGLLIVLLYGILTTFLGLFWAGPLLQIFGATAELYLLSLDYIQIILSGSTLMFFAVLSGSMLHAQGDAGTPMKSMLTGAIINIILDPFLIFGIGPFPMMEVKGAALATVIGQVGSCSVNFHRMFIQNRVSLSLQAFHLDLNILGEIYKVGFPSMIMQFMNSILIVIINWMLGSYSYLAISAAGIYFRVQSLIFMPVLGLTQGFLPIAGFAFGAGRLDRLKEAIKDASIGAFLFMSLGFAFFQLVPGFIISLFNQDPQLIKIGTECMRLISILLPLVGPSIILSTLFQAVGKGFTAMWLSLLRQVVFLLPALLLLSHYLGIKGIWLAFPASDILSIIVTVYVSWMYLKRLGHGAFGQSPSEY